MQKYSITQLYIHVFPYSVTVARTGKKKSNNKKYWQCVVRIGSEFSKA